MRTLGIALIVAAGLLVVPGAGSATIIGGPAPLPGFGADDFSEAYLPDATLVSVELLDLAGASGQPSSFGFYYQSDPGTLIPVLGPTDQGGFQQASVNFGAGVVLDVDAGVPEGTFSPGAGPIGFFLRFGSGPGAVTLFSEPSLNGGVDATATFPSLGLPSTVLIGMEVAGAGPGGSDVTMLLNLVSGVAGVPGGVVPEPGGVVLFCAGLMLTGLTLRGRMA